MLLILVKSSKSKKLTEAWSLFILAKSFKSKKLIGAWTTAS